VGKSEKPRDIVSTPRLDAASQSKADATGEAGHNHATNALTKSTENAAPIDTSNMTASITAKDVVRQNQATTPKSISSIKPIPGGRTETASQAHKTKPPTPPKKDLSAVLKPRPAAGNSVQPPPPPQQQQQEPEFKNIFGKLRHTKTQKYVAPDELKDNILRGKASLHTTGGPVKQERKDELKESILRQKETMLKAKSSADDKPSVLPSSSDAKDAAGKPEEERRAGTPEAVARRRLFSKSVSSGSGSARSSATAEPATPEALLKLKVIKDGSKANLPPVSGTAQSPSVRIPAATVGPTTSAFNQRLATFIARGPQSSPSSSAPVTGSGAGLQPEKAASSEPAVASASAETKSLHHEDDDAVRPLTHLTKGRARGPKRRPPQSMAG
jgi:hypothetical protein